MDEYKRRRRRSRAVMSMFLDSFGGSIDNVDVASFDSDGSDLKALVVGIEPIQDLHGYDSPWPAGGGKNLYNPATVVENQWINDITGELSPATGFWTTDYIPVTAGSTYYRPQTGSSRSCWYDSSKNTLQYFGANGNAVTVPTGAAYVRFSGIEAAYPHATARIQFEAGSTATEWTPYSNICPISGRTSVNVIVSPTLNPLDGTITNISLGGTCYGGQLDVLLGVLTDANANIPSYNGEAINEPWISSMDAYSPGATPITGAQVVYPLATPQTIQLTGQQIATFLGTNNVWCDSGKIIHLEY